MFDVRARASSEPRFCKLGSLFYLAFMVVCWFVCPQLSAIDVDGATECNTPFDPSRVREKDGERERVRKRGGVRKMDDVDKYVDNCI